MEAREVLEWEVPEEIMVHREVTVREWVARWEALGLTTVLECPAQV
jgi:hypothetical protein